MNRELEKIKKDNGKSEKKGEPEANQARLTDEELKKVIEEAKEILQIKGISGLILTKLVSAGITSLRSLSLANRKELIGIKGIGEKYATKLLHGARLLTKKGLMSAEEDHDKRLKMRRITTSSKSLDNILGGGVETGAITEFFGASRMGKTQLAHQLCVNAQLPLDKGGLNGNALYIGTETTFRSGRIGQMCAPYGLNPSKARKNIFLEKTLDSDEQIRIIKAKVPIYIKAKNIKLVVIDSIIANFRSEYIGGAVKVRQQLLGRHIQQLKRLAEEFPDVAFVVTNQVTMKPDLKGGGAGKNFWAGGNIVAHGSVIRVSLYGNGDSDIKNAQLLQSPIHENGTEAIFKITKDGIRDIYYDPNVEELKRKAKNNEITI